ncbi:hypothetical protein QZH41_012275 [Actinostola sp. cb2023]|nr:hypothetical protein QZH41_012275 [Actinostola sp. cb2023]
MVLERKDDVEKPLFCFSLFSRDRQHNGADSDSSSGVEKFKTRVIISNDGSVAWFSPALYITTCRIDTTYFPFDEQKCTMKFGSWTFMETEVDVVPSAKAIFSDKYIVSTEWELISAWKQRQTANYTCCEKPLSFIVIEVMIRRKPLFYAFNLITPCMIFMSVILLGFCLPPESRERITLNITVLLAMAVFLQLMAKSLPRNADTTPLLGRFYITIMTEIALSLVATCFVLNLHHRNLGPITGPQIPTWVDVVVLHWLAAVLCVRRPPNEFEIWDHQDIEKMSFSLNTNHKPNSGSDVTVTTMNGHAQGAKPAVRKYHTKIAYNEGLPLTTFMRCRSLSSKYQSSKDLGVLARNRDMRRQTERRNRKWKHVAMVMDRLFLWIFVVSIVISTSAVFKERIRQSLGEDYS